MRRQNNVRRNPLPPILFSNLLFQEVVRVIRPNKHMREKSLRAPLQRVWPVLELLEGRQPPSSFPVNQFLTFPLEEPSAVVRELKTTTDNRSVLSSRELTHEETTPLAAPDLTRELALRSSPILGLTDPDLMSLGQAAAPVHQPSASSDSQATLPGGLDLPASVNFLGELPLARTSKQHQQSACGQQPGDPPPEITAFTVSQNDDGSWTFEGHVHAICDGGLTIDFGSSPESMPSVDGQTALVDSTGNFEFTTTLQSCEQGTVTAQTTDSQGHSSNMATDSVHQTGCGNRPGR